MVTSSKAFKQALNVIPGGVNSPVRAFQAVGGRPIFFAKGEGPFLFDIEGIRYIDHVCSWGPLILGHAHPDVTAAIQEAASRGSSFGAPTQAETQLAEMVIERIPSIEKVRLVNSGTEAAMSAIRLARGFTGRDFVVKFDGCYHGHVDALLVSAGSGAATFGVPSSPGIPKEYVQKTLVLPFNDLEALRALFAKQGDQIACVIVEPVMANMGVIFPDDGFLEGLREITRQHDTLLIFDEVITGLRVHPGGAQGLFNITPDLTVLGKIIGGGLPVGAYGGRAHVMAQIAPDGPVYQAGTLSGNPIAVAAGIATLEALSENLYAALEQKGRALQEGLQKAADSAGAPLSVTRAGSLLGLSFLPFAPRNAEHIRQVDTDLYAQTFRSMLEAGIYLAPSAFEACFVSAAHDEAVINETVLAFKKTLSGLSF